MFRPGIQVNIQNILLQKRTFELRRFQQNTYRSYKNGFKTSRNTSVTSTVNKYRFQFKNDYSTFEDLPPKKDDIEEGMIKIITLLILRRNGLARVCTRSYSWLLVQLDNCKCC